MFLEFFLNKFMQTLRSYILVSYKQVKIIKFYINFRVYSKVDNINPDILKIRYYPIQQTLIYTNQMLSITACGVFFDPM